jgi:glycosyltransferase involved in cell wall biosynthesis
MDLVKKDLKYILPVAIMAHNEEKVIEKAITSVLGQRIPTGYSIKVLVSANGCCDRTEEIVTLKGKEHPDKVDLVSIKEKGKTKAINSAIKFLDRLVSHGSKIPYVIFLDADCEFVGKEVLINFNKRFELNPQLCAVGADCVPDVVLESRKDIVAEIYKATYTLGQSLKINSISGMCYGVRLEALKKIEFPDFQFAEDMYVSSRLDGWFLRDKGIKIIFKTPSNFMLELRRRTRQEISTRRYHEYYSYLERKGIKVCLFEKPLGDDYRWWGAKDDHLIKAWFKSKGIKPKYCVIAYALITLWAKIKARYTLTKMKENEDLNYWKVVR